MYFALNIFLSAFLLFQVQPMIAKYILPWFGGTHAVWSTVMFFFQVLLTGGYAYASWIIAGKRRREVIHLGLLTLSIAIIVILGLLWKSPITPDSSWKPDRVADPIWQIFLLLAISIGLPYFLLSTNSPLMQAWFNRVYPHRTAYRLYALSNAGSLLGLITYPVLVEPTMSLALQGWVWSIGFIVYALVTGYGTVRSLRIPQKPSVHPAIDVPVKGERAGVKVTILWIALSANASIHLLATTSHITQEVAVIPFLWVLPLAIYLVSFILSFSGEKWYSRQVFLIILFVATILASWAMAKSESLGIPVQIGVYSLLLFAVCMVCHGELYSIRPAQQQLTKFYFLVSVGGALGGLIIIFVAPNIFRGYWELPLGIGLCWLLFLVVSFIFRPKVQKRWVFVVNTVILLSAMVLSSVRAFQQIRADLTSAVTINRNYYGVVRVKELGAEGWSTHRYALVHGVTIHGYQLVDPESRATPTAYFGETSGGGLAILNHPSRGQGMRVGILGLGIGTLAAYGQRGDIYRFYEINPLVIELAEGAGGYFSFLSDSQAEIEIIPGDARLSLEEELTTGHPQAYDLLVLDVFSSDSIPVHLIDREAFEIYLQHINNGGILALHISNRHLDLVPVAWTLADHFNLNRVVIDDPGDGSITARSLWVLMAINPDLLASPEISSRAMVLLDYAPRIRLWTDDYSNLFQVLK